MVEQRLARHVAAARGGVHANWMGQPQWRESRARSGACAHGQCLRLSWLVIAVTRGVDEPNEGVLLPLLPLQCERPDEVNLANAALIDCPCTPPLLPVPRPSAVNIAALRIASL